MTAKQLFEIGNCLDVLKKMSNESIDVCVTSPPYWALRDYGSEPVIWNDSKCGTWKGQLGLEPTFNMYIEHLMMIFTEVKRVLKPTGSCWINLGDTYNGNKRGNTDEKQGKIESGELDKKSSAEVPNKSLCQIPSRFSIAMTDAGWCLRNKIIWHKPNVMPQSCTDRFTNDYEEFFFFTKSQKYYFIQQKEPVKEVSLKRAEYGFKSVKANLSGSSKAGIDVEKMGKRFVNSNGRNMRCVWNIPTSGSHLEHVAMFPSALIDIPIRSCCPPNGTVLDPFCGSGTVLEYCRRSNINAIGIEINADYKKMITGRGMIDIPQLDEYDDKLEEVI